MDVFVTTFNRTYLDAAIEVVTKANRKAARSGIKDQFEVAHSTATIYRKDQATGLQVAEDLTTFAVVGKPLVIEGWTFVATITWDSETGLPVTRPVPGIVVDLSKHRDAQVCDHCNTRRHRKDTYIVREDATGATKQVGSNCLANFFGISVDSALWLIDVQWEERLEGSLGSSGETRLGTSYVLGLASAAVALHGWVPGYAEGRKTSDRVANAIWPPKGDKPWERDLRAEAAALVEAIKADGGAQKRADEVLAWVKSDLFNGGSEYVTNLKNACAGETISVRNLNLVVSAVAAWKRANEQAAAPRTEVVSEFVGSVGDRLRDLRLTVKAVRWFEGQYGTTTLLAMTDESGNAYKWFASGSYDFEAGAQVTLTGTVKAHEEYKGRMETVLTRCKIA